MEEFSNWDFDYLEHFLNNYPQMPEGAFQVSQFHDYHQKLLRADIGRLDKERECMLSTLPKDKEIIKFKLIAALAYKKRLQECVEQMDAFANACRRLYYDE